MVAESERRRRTRRAGRGAGRSMTPRTRKALTILAYVAVLASLYLVLSFALFLGLQVAPIYGNIGIAVTVALAALHVCIDFIGK